MPAATKTRSGTTSRYALGTNRSTRHIGRYSRGSAQRRGRGLGRKPPQQSGIKKMLGAVVPGAAAKRAAPSSKKGKAGGLALLAAAAGMAFKNRDKLQKKRTGADAPPSGPVR
jgi:hypothetical protein